VEHMGGNMPRIYEALYYEENLSMEWGKPQHT
jgi:hypothetical protein